ncbi:zinc finger protein 58-like isoform X1 [Helicoverpa zea]|uniref:zinc finger protein 58-like isoform X1 n=1 Tax=Helicoverpa zea TaxID=7113 RepID=UPI001F5AFE64|nr:zinc finger protein 58-like isoform X1 [Helicoverpa zea]
MDVKVECERLLWICHGCLSADRNLACVTGHNKTLFNGLRGDVTHQFKDLLLCWECVALINKLGLFRSRIKTAQYRLLQFVKTFESDLPITLSHIKITQKQQYDYEYKYIDEEEQKHIILDHKDKLPDQNETIIEYKDENITEIDPEIKIEYNEDIKDEIDNISYNNDTDYEEFKLEHDLDCTIENKKPKKRIKQSQSIKKLYEKYATITKKEVLFNRKEHSEEVCLNDEAIEQFLDKDRAKRTLESFPYKCMECSLGYVRELDYFRHQTFRHLKIEYPTSCLACKQKNINSQSNLEEHWRVHTLMLQCKLCGEITRFRGMKKHFNIAHTKVHTCKECSLEFGSLRVFSEHYKSMHKIAICDHCNKKFTSRRKLERHIFRNHQPQQCTICNRQYRAYKFYKSHLRAEHPELLSSLQALDSNKEMRYCVECDIQFPSIYKYKRHLQESVKHKPKKKERIPCPDCGKIFTRMVYKNNHYRLAHMKVTKHYCEICNKYFSNGYGLRKHIKGVHEKIPLPKNKICDLCGRGFSANRILANHRRTHTGERPYKCEFCPATFAQQTALKTHQKTQHKHSILLAN